MQAVSQVVALLDRSTDLSGKGSKRAPKWKPAWLVKMERDERELITSTSRLTGKNANRLGKSWRPSWSAKGAVNAKNHLVSGPELAYGV